MIGNIQIAAASFSILVGNLFAWGELISSIVSP